MDRADVDECSNGLDNCDSAATCTNTPGGFDCQCPAGYSIVSAGVVCDYPGAYPIGAGPHFGHDAALFGYDGQCCMPAIVMLSISLEVRSKFIKKDVVMVFIS